MGEFIATDCKIYLGKYDFSAQANQVSLETNAEVLDATAFGDTYRIKTPGFVGASGSIDGYYEAGVDKIDTYLFDNLAVSDQVLSICPTDGTDGEPAKFLKAVSLQYNPISGGTIGEMLMFNAQFEASNTAAILGTVAKNGTVTATGNGTGYQLGALSSTQTMYAALHIVSASGTTPSIDVVIESDDNGSFTSATERIAFTNATDTTSEWSTVAGAVTDDYWRVKYTISGTTPSFDIVVVMGIK